MQVRVVPAGRGWQWIADGFSLFRRNPAMWIALTLVLGAMWAGSLIIPLIGPLLFNLFLPMFFAGMLAGCRALEAGEPLQLNHLFIGFREQTVPLVTVGGVYLVGTVVVLGIVLLFSGSSMLPAVMEGKGAADPETLRAAVRSLLIGLAAGAAAYLPLIMALWFAPPLVLFERTAPVEALRLSFVACLRNTVPFLVYGLALVGLWLVITLPAAFGPLGAVLVFGLLIASMPVMVCSVYASYRDVFGAPGGGAASTNPFLK